MRYYSQSTGCTYLTNIHSSWPDDSVELSEAAFIAVIANPPLGKVRSHDKDGYPILIDAAPGVSDAPAVIAAERFRRETSGFIWNGAFIDTGRESQALITGARLAAIDNPDLVCNWKTPSGFILLTADQLREVAAAVRLHVQRCFDREAELLTALANGAFRLDILKVGWPDEPDFAPGIP